MTKILEFDNLKINHADQSQDLSNTQLAIFCDFDGTITTTDTTDVLLEELADPEWLAIEERWKRGELDEEQCLSQQIPLIRGGWSAIARVLDTIDVDPNFKPFSQQCRAAGIPLYIASGSLDKTINYFLDREGIHVDAVWASKLSISSNGDLSIECPYAKPKGICRLPVCGACKCALMDAAEPIRDIPTKTCRVVIGDGRSDFCWVQQGDLVFAKPKLAQYCSEQNINYVRFADFTDVHKYLSKYPAFAAGAAEKYYVPARQSFAY